MKRRTLLAGAAALGATPLAAPHAQKPVTGTDKLSDRELEVFELIGHGLSTSKIAGKLNLSEKTIETYRAHIKGKLNLDDAASLTRAAVYWVEVGSGVKNG